MPPTTANRRNLCPQHGEECPFEERFEAFAAEMRGNHATIMRALTGTADGSQPGLQHRVATVETRLVVVEDEQRTTRAYAWKIVGGIGAAIAGIILAATAWLTQHKPPDIPIP